MTGYVTARRIPLLPLRVRGPAAPPVDIVAVLDTGFTGDLALPAATAAALGLTPAYTRPYFLADGSMVDVEIFDAEVEWGPGWRAVKALAIGPDPAVGMALLEDHKLFMEVIAAGVIDIQPMP